MNNFYHQRIKKLSQFLTPDQGLILSTPADIEYLTGFKHLVPEERESFLLITLQSNTLFHASFSPYKAPPNVNHHLGCSLDQVSTALRKLNKDQKIKKLLVDKSSLFVDEYETLSQLSFLNLSSFDRQQIWKLRTVKDPHELKHLKKAGQITSGVMKIALDSLKEGLTELELREIIELELKKAGAEDIAFPTIVAFGKNSALPHHQPTTTKLKAGMAILIDMGAKVNGYHGDMTRTIWFGQKVPTEFLKVEQTVKAAYQAALNVFSNQKQILAKDLDQAARSVITKVGYGREFIHTTGHGLGLDIHENLSLHWKNEQPILPQMMITIEPGIYLKNKFGYRYENMVLVTKSEAKEITYD